MIGEISGDFLQWLRGFYWVASQGSLRQAAVAMGREKATVSRQIQCLEKELGVTLFDRSSGKMMITPQGRMLQEEAAGLFEYLTRIKDEIKSEKIHFQGKISIATTPAIIDNILPAFVDRFQKLHPEVIFQLDGTIQEKILEKVESAEVDFGVTFFETGHKSLMCHYLYEDGLFMIAPRNNPYFPGKGLPALKQIAEAPLILFAHGGSHKPLIEERFAKYRLNPNVVQIHNNFVSIKNYVARRMGIAILSGHALSPGDDRKFDIYSLDGYFPKRKYGILLKKKKYLSLVVKAFLQTLKPDIEFSDSPAPSEEVPVLSLAEFLRCREELDP